MKKFFIRLLISFCAGLLIAAIIISCSINAHASSLPDITEPCEMSTEELSAVLKHDLKNYAEAFLQAEEDYGINACFLASIAAHESGWGRSDLAKEKNNLFGWKGKDGFKDFESPEKCIDYVAWRLSKKYINKGFDTIEKIAPVYCDAEWAGYINNIYWGLVS